jgi:hypothetical protein
MYYSYQTDPILVIIQDFSYIDVRKHLNIIKLYKKNNEKIDYVNKLTNIKRSAIINTNSKYQTEKYDIDISKTNIPTLLSQI